MLFQLSGIITYNRKQDDGSKQGVSCEFNYEFEANTISSAEKNARKLIRKSGKMLLEHEKGTVIELPVGKAELYEIMPRKQMPITFKVRKGWRKNEAKTAS